MSWALNSSLLPAYSRLYVPANHPGNVITHDLVRGLNAEVGVFGYTLSPALLQRIAGLDSYQFNDLRRGLTDTLKVMTGDTRRHHVLFNKFPYSTPDEAQYLMSRLLSYFEHEIGADVGNQNNYQILSCGHVLDPTRYDATEFGACPVCQEQVPELLTDDLPVFPFTQMLPFKYIDLASDKFLAKTGAAILSRNSSLSPTERKLVVDIANLVDIEKPSKVFKETLPLVYSLYTDEDYLRSLMSGATDVLRVATYLSNNEGDLSLSENTKFKVRTADKKRLLHLLESLPNIEEDLLRHREKWLRLGERLNPGTASNRVKYPRVASAFDRLRNNPECIRTYTRDAELTIREKAFTHATLKKLAERPGEFMRRIDVILRANACDVKTVFMPIFVSDVLPKVTTKMLLEVRKYLEHRGSPSATERVFIPKGISTKAQVVADKRPPIHADVLDLVVGGISLELLYRFGKQGDMGKVYVDPKFKGYVLPFNRRADSETASPVLKGSRIPFSQKTATLRMFVHWTKDTDVDLSAVMLDEDFETEGYVNFTRLSESAVSHSGDIQSAPNGGSEFIDINLAKMARERSNVRYIVMSLYSYRGLPFSKFPCFAGFMERDKNLSGMRYEPSSVSLKFDVSAETTNFMPLALDVKTREIVYMDMVAGGTSRYGTVNNYSDRLAMLARAIVDMPNRRVTVYDVLASHAAARGDLVDDKKDADRRYLASEFTPEMLEEVLALTADVDQP